MRFAKDMLRRYFRESRDLGATPRVVDDVVDNLGDLMELEQRHWSSRMRVVKATGEPVMGLGFAGPVIPNFEPANAPAAVTTTTARTVLYTLTNAGTSSWMWIPYGNFRSPQAWLVWASGTAASTTSSTIGWTTAVGQTAIAAPAADTNAVVAANGALTPGFNGTTNWNYRGHATITLPGTSGNMKGGHEVQISNNAAGSATNTVTGLGGVAAGITLDTTQGAYWAIDLTNSTTANSVQLVQMVILACD